MSMSIVLCTVDVEVLSVHADESVFGDFFMMFEQDLFRETRRVRNWNLRQRSGLRSDSSGEKKYQI